MSFKVKELLKETQEEEQEFNRLRLKGKFCDIIIKTEGVEFQAHKIILCRCSPYFRSLLEHWSPDDKKIFEIPGVPPEAMGLIVEYVYTGTIHLTKDNVQDLIMAADMLKITRIVDLCANYLREQVCAENCICIWQLTSFCVTPELRNWAFRFILKHFSQVILSDEFLELSVNDLCKILEHDELNVRLESVVFDCIIRWIAHMPEEREEHIDVLFPKARLALTSLNYVNNHVKNNELIIKSEACQNAISDIVKTLRVRERPTQTSFSNPLARPRMPSTVMLAIGGWTNNCPVYQIESFDERIDEWVLTPSLLSHVRAYHATVFLNNYVYCIGGFDRVEYYNSVSRLDLTTHSWTDVSNMQCRRCYVSAAMVNGFIYAIGGYDGHSRLNSAEYYNPATNQWTLTANMRERRSDANCTSLNGKIYICGGFDGNTVLQTAECYNPEANQWTTIANMISRRSGIGVTAAADHVFVIGGYDGHNRLTTVESYNPMTNTWETMSSMLTPRSNFGIGVINDHIYVVGGYTGVGTTKTVEYYSCERNEWLNNFNLYVSRSALTCVVVSDLSNIGDYTIPRDNLPLLELDECGNEIETGVLEMETETETRQRRRRRQERQTRED